jgi:hypothetical protein
MKKLLLAGCLIATSVMANSVPQQFYRASSGQSLIEAGWFIADINQKLEGAGQEETTSYLTDLNLAYSYGINKDMAVGVEITSRNSTDGTEGLADHRIFFEGQREKLFYGVGVNIASCDSGAEDCNGTGGTYADLTVGYAFHKNAGLRIDYTMGYDQAQDGGGADVAKDADMNVGIYYERMFGDHLFGASIFQNTVGKTEGGNDLTWTKLQLYGVYEMGAFDITPALDYWLGDTDGVDTLNATAATVAVRYDF